MPDGSPSGSALVALRLTLFVTALVCAAMALPAFTSRERIERFVAGYLQWADVTPPEGAEDTESQPAETSAPDTPGAPAASFAADPLPMFVIRLASLAMTVPALLCLVAMAGPRRCRAVLFGLVLGALVTGGGSVWLGRREGVDLLLYAPVSIVSLMLGVLLLALFPRGRRTDEDSE